MDSTQYSFKPRPEYVQEPINFNNTDPKERERLIMEDLLSILVGCSGEYIRVEGDQDNLLEGEGEGISFKLIETTEVSIAQLIQPFLKVASQHKNIVHFSQFFSRFGFGQVNHALCSGIKALLNEYYILIAQLEHQLRETPGFSIHKFRFYFQPTLNTMRVLSDLVLEIQARVDVNNDKDELEQRIMFPEIAKGGSILDLLEQNMVRQSG